MNPSRVLKTKSPAAAGRLLLALLLTGLAAAQGAQRDPDPIWASQQSFVSAAARGMADAGAALPWSAASAGVNPGLLYSCRNTGAPIFKSAYCGYGRDSLFGRYNLPFGAAYMRKRDAAALHCRVLSSDFGIAEFGAAATLCRRLWSRADPQGPLDVGVNLRYEYADWGGRGIDTALCARAYYDLSGRKVRPDEVLYQSRRRQFSEQRAILDIGVFKPDIATHVDCGLYIRNLAAYRWRAPQSMEVVRRDTTGVMGDTSVVLELYRYGKGHEAAEGAFVPADYATAAFGCTFKFPIPGRNLYLSFPFEVRSYGLLNPDMKKVFAVHAGGQAHFMKNIFVRAGFQRAPGLVYADTLGSTKIVIQNMNNATLGASLMPPGLPCIVDCYFGHYEWGLTVSWDY